MNQSVSYCLATGWTDSLMLPSSKKYFFFVCVFQWNKFSWQILISDRLITCWDKFPHSGSRNCVITSFQLANDIYIYIYIYIEPKRSDVDQTEATWIGKISNKTIQGARIAKYHREERYFLLYIRHGDKVAQIVTSVSRWFGCCP